MAYTIRGVRLPHWKLRRDLSGNRNLQPETAYEWTFGAIVTPGKWWRPLQGLTLQADFYHIDLRAVITAILESTVPRKQ